MTLKEYLISIGRLPKETEATPDNNTAKSETPSVTINEETIKQQTVGEVFDMLKERNGNKLPPNFLGANAGIWKTKINHPYLKN